MLCHHGVLDMPLLYLSIFFKEHRQAYYDRLQAVRDNGAWEDWIAFFLEGMATVAHEATETARKIVHLREQLRERLSKGLGRRSGIGLRLLDDLFHLPVVSVKQVEALLGVAQPTASSLVNTLEELGVLHETTGKQRNRVFVLEDEALRTQAADPSQMKDPSLIIYYAMRRLDQLYIVTNGAQTDAIHTARAQGQSFVDALNPWSHEPDAPNFTPRISAALEADLGIIWMSVINRSNC